MVKPRNVRGTVKLGEIIKVSTLSPETIEVIENFGFEAPHLLNQYAIALEDALIEQVDKTTQLVKTINKLKEEIKQLKNPDV